MKRKTFFALLLMISLLAVVPAKTIIKRPFSLVLRDDLIAQKAESLRDKLITQRRDFHQYPELSNREERTSRVVAEKLKALGLEDIKINVAKHGVTALLKGKKPGPIIAVRADMDALPIQETNDVPYKSRNAGVKHACGHDAHTTIGLGVAELLIGMREQIQGTVKFVFQPAEEGPPAGEEGGARLMIKDGALDNPKPEAIFGLHVMPTIEVGQVGYTSGPAMASSDKFFITIRGKSTHGAAPHNGIDPIVVSAEAISALQTIRSRRIDTQEPIVISIGKIQGGNRFNIIANEVILEGTMRTLNEDVRKRAQEMMREILDGVTKAFGSTYEIKFEENAAVTINAPALVEEIMPTMRRVVGDKNIVVYKPQMIAEDFSYYQQIVPGFFYYLGVSNKQKGFTAMLHTADFDLDEEAMVIGVKLMSNVLLDYMDKHSR